MQAARTGLARIGGPREKNGHRKVKTPSLIRINLRPSDREIVTFVVVKDITAVIAPTLA